MQLLSLSVNANASIINAMTRPDKTTVEIWIGLNRAHRAILSSVEKSLKNASMPPLSWYDVLLELDNAGSDGTRAYLLQDKLLLPQYALSRLIERIENAGFLQRQSCTDDGRGQILLITRSGKLIRKKIWSIYGKALQQAVGSKLSHDEKENLLELLVQMK
ncbi:MAG: MarR family winged helix-turn-helix transcriptional regulator [Devosiaceae bacterium]|nr:MarR family winged helix-turn-helix transcriptional regulator [Devosiaceae bacterium]